VTRWHRQKCLCQFILLKMKRNHFIICALFVPLISFSQKEANNWYFGYRAAISFEDGSPTALFNSMMNADFGIATISDSLGILLFYTNGEHVYNRMHSQMPRGYGLLGAGGIGQTCIIIPRPSHRMEYYIFTVGMCTPGGVMPTVGLNYSKVNMNLDSGLGDIDPFFKNIELSASNLALQKITAVRHANNHDVWVIVRHLSEPINQYHSYLVTDAGISPTPIKSDCLSNIPTIWNIGNTGQLKISPDSRYLVSTNRKNYGGYEIGYFNNLTGEISLLFNFVPQDFYGEFWGVEFSSDSKYVYLTNWLTQSYNKILQYDLSLLPDKDLFLNSRVDVGKGGNASDLQMGPDGKIYVARKYEEYLGVINNPGAKGLACDYDSLGVYLGGRICYNGLPQFIQSYFLRFEFEGKCAGESFQFTPNFNPLPDSIHWDFGDPASGTANFSNDLSPAHIYQQGGTYTVTVFVRYPDGRQETAQREVIVSAIPSPYPGIDTIVCKGTNVQLQAVEGFDSYLWSTNQTSSFISVSDTGTYWVEAVNIDGCMGRDSVRVSWYPVPVIDSLIVSPTTCGNSTGAIRIVQLSGGSPPFQYRWIDNSGTVVSTTPDAYNLPVDNYSLWITDNNGCTLLLRQIDIQNIDSTLIIKDVLHENAYCNQSTGSIQVKVEEGLIDMLLYSINNGIDYYFNEGDFSNLIPGFYTIRVKDSAGCEAVYRYNPVEVESLKGLQVISSPSTPETDNDANGTISIIATGDSLTYYLEGTASDNPYYTGLVKGEYTIRVTDKHGCDSTFIVIVDRISGNTLHAIAGDTIVCEGLRVREPLLVNNFKDIQSFELNLSYNHLLLEAVGFDQANSQLLSGLQPMVYPGTGTIRIKWSGTTPITLPDNALLFDLIFQSRTSGFSHVDWVVNEDTATVFFDRFGNSVKVEPQRGSVEITPAPKIWSMFQPSVCQGSELMHSAFPTGGSGVSQVLWETPKGNSSGVLYSVPSAELADEGMYRVKVIDELNCMAIDSVEVKVIPLPEANFPAVNDTIKYSYEYLLAATPGYYLYLWNTGDESNSIRVTDEGQYSVIIKTEEGCADTSAVFMLNTLVNLLVPNAFTPNGDGLNDIFKPLFDLERVKQFSMVIYNKWGQRIFETTNPLQGWNGNNAPGDIYHWTITYSDLNNIPNKLWGSVVLIR
jgi:gliding motility-associated-like protein